METTSAKQITVETTVNAPVAKAWEFWSNPEHIPHWCFASDEWHAPHAENDLRIGGKFKTTMAAKDGSFGFDFEGEYTNVVQHQLVEYVLGDSRKVSIQFTDLGNATKVVEIFDMENTHSEEMQRDGWQAILNNFKKYTETPQ